jgi:hypothetical protein
MTQDTIKVDPQLWDEFSNATTKQGKKPRTVLAKLIRDYLEIQADTALFAEMRRDVRGRAINDVEAVEFVKQHRHEKRAERTTRRTR